MGVNSNIHLVNAYRMVDFYCMGDDIMDVMFRVNSNGQPLAAVPMAKDCATLLCSWKAMQELMRQFQDLGAICTRCGMISRTSEIVDTECGPGTGCRGDSDMSIVLELPPQMRIAALTKVVLECEQSFRRRKTNLSDDMED